MKGQTLGDFDIMNVVRPANGSPRPRYLRVLVTRACPMQCPFCHHEGVAAHDPGAHDDHPGGARSVRHGRHPSLEDWTRMLTVAAGAGIRKFKFLGGEPLIAPHLPHLIAHVRAVCPESDISIITSGAAPVKRLEACFESGLSRANLSIHGWTRKAFRHNGDRHLFDYRREILHYLLALERPVKLNYVYVGQTCEDDLQRLLDDMSRPPYNNGRFTVSVLDDLKRAHMSSDTVRDVLRRLCGDPDREWVDEDPASLPATRWRWTSGLEVEIKSSVLGRVAPWGACRTCPSRSRCREGTFALRLDPSGEVRLCMDRPDLKFDLRAISRDDLETAVGHWHEALAQVGGPPGADAA